MAIDCMNIPNILMLPAAIVRADVPLPFPILPLEMRFTPGEGSVFSIERDVAAQVDQRRIEERIFQGLQVKYGGKYGNTVAVAAPDEDFFYAHEATRLLIGNPEIQAILRPALFRLDLSKKPPDIGIGARTAALIRQPDGTFLLADFKAVTHLYTVSRHLDAAGNTFTSRKLRKDFVYELGLKVFIARSAGISISNAGIAHFSADMVHDGSADPAHFFDYTD